jgi:hypothetical protein
VGQGQGQQRCAGTVADTNPVTGRITRRRCPLALDPILTAAGFTTHPGCDPSERSELWPPMTWPDGMLGKVLG